MTNAFRVAGRTVLTYYPNIGVSKLAPFDALKKRLAAEGLADEIALVPYSYVLTKTSTVLQAAVSGWIRTRRRGTYGIAHC